MDNSTDKHLRRECVTPDITGEEWEWREAVIDDLKTLQWQARKDRYLLWLYCIFLALHVICHTIGVYT